MSQHARTFLAQARTAVEGGDAQRAMDLLRRAKLMAGDDPALMARILDEMTRLAPQADCESESEVWHRQLEKLRSRGAPVAVGSGEDHDSARKPARFSPRAKTLIFAACLTALLVPGGIWFWHWSAGRYQSAGVDSVDAITRRQRSLKDNVGFALWIHRYEGSSHGRNIAIEIPGSSGTAFAISPSGYLLTNRHVVVHEDDLPERFDNDIISLHLKRNGPPKLIVCFGPDPKNHHVASIVHKSDRFDLAVLKIDRRFTHPLNLSYRTANQTEPVIACGFPGAVIDLEKTKEPPELFLQAIQIAEVKGFSGYNEFFSMSVFKSTATEGTISGSNKGKEQGLYHLFDAKVTHGNSGGPLIAKNGDQVIGIVTSGGDIEVTREGIKGDRLGYNYALALPQLKDELKRFVP